MLVDVLKGMDYTCLNGELNQEISGLSYHSARYQKGNVFICIEGTHFDSHTLIDELIEQGCRIFVVEKDVPVRFGITYIYVKDSRDALCLMSKNYFQLDDLIFIGVSGTSGKSSVCTMLYDLLKMKYQVGMMNSIGIFMGDEYYSVEQTTPQSYDFFYYCHKMQQMGIRYIIVEVSSQAIKQKRIAHIDFDYVILTNITKDHISEHEHRDFKEYKQCKIDFLKMGKVVILNRDDEAFFECVSKVDKKIYMYSLCYPAHLQAHHINNESYETCGLFKQKIQLKMKGIFNVSNSLAALLCAYLCGIRDYRALSNCQVRGRMEEVVEGVYIDYAHNENAIRQMIQTLNKECDNLICVYGAGGERSVDRRYQVGALMGYYGCLSIITSDNSRGEDFDTIASMIKEGVTQEKGKCVVIENRQTAICYALQIKRKNDYVVCVGKGHEKYQWIHDKKIDFDEKKIILDYYRNKGESV